MKEHPVHPGTEAPNMHSKFEMCVFDSCATLLLTPLPPNVLTIRMVTLLVCPPLLFVSVCLATL